MKKRLFALILMLCMMLSILPMTALAVEEESITGTCGENLTWEIDPYGRMTISGSGEMPDFILDSETGKSTAPWYAAGRAFHTVTILEGVTSIGAYAFAGDTYLQDAGFATVNKIGDHAFDGCSGLTYTSTPMEALHYIGESAFSGCGKMMYFSLPSAVGSNSTLTICDKAFFGCKAFESLYIPNIPIQWGKEVFADSGLKTVKVGCGQTDLGVDTFSGCSSLENVYLPSTVTKFGGIGGESAAIHAHKGSPADTYAEKNGIRLEVVDHTPWTWGDELVYQFTCIYCGIPCESSGDVIWAVENGNKLRVFGSGEFQESIKWDAFKEQIREIEIDEGVTGSVYGFRSWSNVEKVTLPNTVTEIGGDAFYGLSKLTQIDLPDQLVEIRSLAFSGCTGLTDILLPASLTRIGTRVFSGCSNLTGIWVEEASESFSNDEKGVLFSKDKTKLYAAPANLAGDYIVPDTVTYIEEAAFEKCQKLTSVTIPNGMQAVYVGTFQYCTALQSVNIPESVIWISTEAFRGCTALTSIEIPKNVGSIFGTAFQDCTSLREITFRGDFPGIEPNCFSGVTAYAYYPSDNATWTRDKLQDYGGKLTWLPIGATPPAGVEGVTRVFGADRYQTSFKAADTLKAQLGVAKFQNVIVASGTGFADALAGSYLAAVKEAPILLVRGANVNDVKNYIKQNLTAGGTVYLLGGVNAVPKAMESGLEGFNVKRLGGANRYDTNLLILQEAGVGGKDIIVCTGLNFADSLSASATGLPILLVKDGLYANQKEFLKNNGGNFIIVGGTGAVNATVEKQLKTYGSVKRLAGNTRYDTSVLVAKEFFDAPAAAVLAYAQNFPDGLSGGPLAYAVKAPLILTDNNKPTAAVAYATGLGIKSGYVLGGTGLISDKVVKNVFSMTADDTIILK